MVSALRNAQGLAAASFDVMNCANNHIVDGGHEVIAVPTDVTNPADRQRLFEVTAEQFGGVDILVNNAGLFADHPPLATDFAAWEAEWRRTIGTNLLGPANLSLLAAQAMARPDAIAASCADASGR